MSTSFNLSNSYIDFKCDDFSADPTAIYPRLRFRFTIGCKRETIVIIQLMLDCQVKSKKADYYSVGYLIVKVPSDVPAGAERRVEASLDLDYYRLKQIEDARQGDDLFLRIQGYALGGSRVQTGTQNIEEKEFQLDFRKAKSDWVEKILPAMKYKDVSLVEIPNIKDFKEIAEYLDDAWKQKSMGAYDKVLTSCRKTLEQLASTIKKSGFETTEVIDDEKRKIPDWPKFFGDKEIGDIISIINQKIHGFTAPGSHAGKSINIEDADFALLVTHAITNFVLRKSEKPET